MDALLRPAELARELQLSPVRVRQLAAQGRIPFILTPGGHRRFDLMEVRAALARDDTPLWHSSRPLSGLAEDDVWREMRPHLDPLGDHARTIAAYALTEMVNNAIDHSTGSQVSVEARRDGDVIVITVHDDGVGVFHKVRSAFDLPDNFAAVAELTKGKRTTARDKHTGEGIFFTSKAVDIFELSANGIRWVVDNLISDQAVGESHVQVGTRVRLRIVADSTRDLAEIFRAFSDDRDFARSQPIIRLFEIGTEFVSRSEAKRLLSGMEEFSEITLDFDKVTSVGQGFVDEVFRVWAGEHPSVKLSPISVNPAVSFMIERGLPSERPPGPPAG
jgi:excisionase family DNA binding protein